MTKFLQVVVAISLAALLSVAIVSCNPIARKFGGTMTVNLDAGQKLVNATWKENSLWILTKNMTQTDRPESYTFKEDSTFGVIEGKVIIKEHIKAQ